MEPIKKEIYCSPEAKVFEVKMGSVICQSLTDPDDYLNGGDPFNPIIP